LNINLDEATFLKLLKANADRFGDGKAAVRTKSHGIWKSTSWKQYYEKVKHFALGMNSLGLKKGDIAAIIGNNRATTLYAVIGTQAAGGVPVCLHQDSTAAEVAAFLKQFDVKYVIAEDQEQVDKILEVRNELPALGGIIFCDPRGMRRYRDELLNSFDEVLRIGGINDGDNPGLFEKRIADGSGDDLAMLCTTSGSTATPRGAMLTFRNVLGMAESLNQVDAKRTSDEFVSFLPMSWFGEQMTSIVSALAEGFAVNFPEGPETAMADLREIGPHIIFFPPRVWEDIARSVQVRIMETTPFKKFMYRTFMPIGEKVAELRLAGKPVPLSAKMLYGVAHICLFRALRDRLGLSRVRSAMTGGSPLGDDFFKFFHAIGVNLKQVYGLTEVAGIACIHKDGDIRGTTVGKPLPGTEIMISEEGEILLKNNGICAGYYNDSQASTAAMKNGWFRTGDAGRLDQDGHLVVIDRLQDIMRLADGASFAPQLAESKLKFSPYIKEAVVIGSGKPFLTALICIEGFLTGKWAGDNKIAFTTYSDLTAKPEVADFIAAELAKANQELPEAARINRFALLYKDLDADENELTRTGKVRRAEVSERYRDIIEALYTKAETVPIDITIDLQDGKSTRIVSTVHLRNLR